MLCFAPGGNHFTYRWPFVHRRALWDLPRIFSHHFIKNLEYAYIPPPHAVLDKHCVHLFCLLYSHTLYYVTLNDFLLERPKIRALNWIWNLTIYCWVLRTVLFFAPFWTPGEHSTSRPNLKLIIRSKNIWHSLTLSLSLVASSKCGQLCVC